MTRRPTRKRLREAQARLSAIQGERSRRRMQVLCWSAFCRLVAEDKLPNGWQDNPRLAAAVAAVRGSQPAKPK